jgi:1,3-beta-glucanosyltransferase GAS5
MTGVFSGGLVYEWTQETNDYGLVNLSNGNITLLQDYYNLQTQFKNTPIPTGNGGYDPDGPPSQCPPNSTDFTSWEVLPPTPPEAEQYIESGAGQPLGNNGPSNQGQGGSATGPVTAGTNTATGTSCPTCSLSGSSTAKSDGRMLLGGERGVTHGAVLAAVGAIVGAMFII